MASAKNTNLKTSGFKAFWLKFHRKEAVQHEYKPQPHYLDVSQHIKQHRIKTYILRLYEYNR